jgi:hypothetical protein
MKSSSLNWKRPHVYGLCLRADGVTQMTMMGMKKASLTSEARFSHIAETIR